MARVPRKMRALVQVKRIATLTRAELATCFELQIVDVPVPKSGQVLIKVESAAINPSNLSALQGLYASSASTPLPELLGTEGCGTVVAVGGGLWPWCISGKRVATMVSSGMWAEYVVADALQCVVLPDDVSFEEGTSCFANPLTAISFVQIAQANHCKSIVQTAAASALGKMIVRDEQVKALRQVGAKHVVNTSKEDWKDELTKLSNPSVHAKSELFIYGNLTGKPWANFAPGDIRFNNKKITGFYVTTYLKQQGPLAMLSMLGSVSSGIKSTFATSVNASYPLEHTLDAIVAYSSQMTNKVVLKPQEKQVTPATAS
ncbi:hypothetical protein Ae201684_006823 [Aphanomyces euteiches]|uniref:Enoyl reductase (ER) domain-containing protein n=1 Tax=Aphanomyces euteiches TaxID=100861 RepID=A0A6G0XA62_9STRA|nr:hypothetical protein Ae201684_006823 [Aphanomyces euteiches]